MLFDICSVAVSVCVAVSVMVRLTVTPAVLVILCNEQVEKVQLELSGAALTQSYRCLSGASEYEE